MMLLNIVTKCYKWKISIKFGSGRISSDTKPKQVTLINNQLIIDAEMAFI